MRIFLLAHPDDEIFLIPYILSPEKKLFIYLTNGVTTNSPVHQRADRIYEARLIFNECLVRHNSRVEWWGVNKRVSDGELYKHVNEKNIESIRLSIINLNEPISLILTTAFEGAHQDHDASAVISRILAQRLRVQIMEISTYPQWFSKIYSFRVLRPRNRLKPQDLDRFPVLDLAVKLMRLYKSQRKTWIVLGPAVLFSFAFRKYYPSSPQPIGKLKLCFYEFRGRAKQEEVLYELSSIS